MIATQATQIINANKQASKNASQGDVSDFTTDLAPHLSTVLSSASAAELNTELDTALNTAQQRQLRVYLEQGLPLVAHPYQLIANELKVNESQVIAQIKDWQQEQLIRRLGLVVKHRQLGYHANAMVVWDVNAQDITEIARRLTTRQEVSLCYQRPRRLPHWPYNLFCMIHGKDRTSVIQQINILTTELALEDINKNILFSYKAFKQHGARYSQRTNQDV